MKYLVGFVAGLLVVGLAVLAYVYSGAFDVAASRPHGGLSAWLVRTAMERSVATRADAVAAPAQFTDAQVQAGFREYDSECVQCHGAPGVAREEWAEDMQPEPPDLTRAARQWSNAELFWIIRNGVKMTGMPAMGAHHSEADIWNLVAFVRTLPEHSAEEYRQMRQATAGQPAPHTHQDGRPHAH